MTAPAPDDRPTELRGVARCLPPIEVDCGGWDADLPEEMWCVGSFRSPARALAAVEADCSAWDAGPAMWLELVVTFQADTPPAQVMQHANRLIGLAHAAAPGLELAYDFARSRTEGDDVVIALTPRAGGAGREFESSVEKIQAGLSRSPDGRAAVRLRRSA